MKACSHLLVKEQEKKQFDSLKYEGRRMIHFHINKLVGSYIQESMRQNNILLEANHFTLYQRAFMITTTID
jgi:hypothetical protein